MAVAGPRSSALRLPAGTRTRKPAASRERRDPVHAHARPREPIANGAVGLEPDPGREGRAAGRVELHERLAPRREQLARAPQQQVGRAADADVAVEQQHRPVAPGAGHGAEDVAADRRRAPPAREPDRDGGEVEAEAFLAGLAKRSEVAAGPAPEVEHGRLGDARSPRGRARRARRASGRAAAARASRRASARARAPEARRRAVVLRSRAGARTRGRPAGGPRRASPSPRSCRPFDARQRGGEAGRRSVGGDSTRVGDRVDVAEWRQDGGA